MADYTVGQLVVAAAAAGFTGPNLIVAVAVSLAENPQRDSHAVNHNSNGTTDVGAWQINSSHHFTGDATNIYVNAQQAYAVYHAGWKGKANSFGAWTTYRNKAYRKHLLTAQTANAQTIANAAAGVGTPMTGPVAALEGAGIPNPLSWGKAVAAFIGKVMDPEFWKMVGVGAIAFLFLILGFVLIAESNKDVRSITKVAAVA